MNHSLKIYDLETRIVVAIIHSGTNKGAEDIANELYPDTSVYGWSYNDFTLIFDGDYDTHRAIDENGNYI